ncbi:hypothetical protein ACQPYH_28260 [Kribbella sp. CA-245084]|uniref:hypothetical protein n=1 Tax=Kribbella sp. CA-245084 TaxID=3239940 RepID=UPI003D8A5F82
MAVGQATTKQTWLLDEVEIRGIVAKQGAVVGTEVGTSDDFDVAPSDGYQHLVSLIPGSNGVMHCETYPLPHDHTNHDESWPLPQKDSSTAFDVLDPASGTRRPLRIGDHVRVVGRWTIDHHPESCVTRQRGWLRVGCVWPEFHPFRWDDIRLVGPPPASGQEVATLSLAAPLHEEVYLGGWKWMANELAGVASKVFVSDDGSNYHNTVSAALHVDAPPLPSGWTPSAQLLEVVETVTRNGTGAAPDSVRSIARHTSSIDVTATITAPGRIDVGGGLMLGDVNDPANRQSVFQSRYAVGWRPRLAAGPVSVSILPSETAADFDLVVHNVGPDTVTITSAATQGNDAAMFAITSSVPIQVPGSGQATLHGRFTAPTSGLRRTSIVLHSNDPAGDPLLVDATGKTGDTSGRLRVRTEPARIVLGRAVSLSILADDTGSGVPVAGQARVLNYTATGKPTPFQQPTNTPMTVTFFRQKEFDPELKKWIFGDVPSGVVNAPGYDQDPDAEIPFRFS